MNSLTWNDNICTVGWTSIHATMTPSDMRKLIVCCPKGSFTGTSSDSGECDTPEELERKLESINLRRAGFGLTGIDGLGFYFNFPLDENGINLIKHLGFDPTKARFYSRKDER